MKARLFHPKDPALRGLVESFLFLESDGAAGAYTTFPNTNLCVAIYRGNEAVWDRTINQCRVRISQRTWSSRLYGFHQRPFHVDWQGPVQQVNILFRPGALSRFTRVPIRLIDMVDDPLTEIFGPSSTDLVDQLFSTTDITGQVHHLETFLLAHLLPVTPRIASVGGVIECMRQLSTDAKLSVQGIAEHACSSPSTIYRSMMDMVGQPPKVFYRTLRFRRSLHAILAGNGSGTTMALDQGFFDQAHFIKDVQQFTGLAPGTLQRSAQVMRGEFVWMRR